MLVSKLSLVLFSIFFYVSYCQRRIRGGSLVTVDKPYAVYIVKATAEQMYDAWLCSGTLVSREHILTSAACVQNVKFLYAIAGTRKYVQDDKIEIDDCTKDLKKKVVWKCIPVRYEFEYHRIEKWASIDIALIKVESPYDKNDGRYQTQCSYIPTFIPVNYGSKYQLPGRDTFILGWGHNRYWRKHGEKKNYNQDLHYAATKILDKPTCKEAYKDYPELVKIIDDYMICTNGPGDLDDKGNKIERNHTMVDHCVSRQQKLMGVSGVPCEDKGILDSKRRNMNVSRTSKNNDKLADFNETVGSTRRTEIGICQNDHGGPLITWVGSQEYVIGVASVFKINEKNECIGPYLFTSTQCNGAFINCTLHHRKSKRYNMDLSVTETDFCDSHPSIRGYDVNEEYISWKDHPSGPADNERRKSTGRNKPQQNIGSQPWLPAKNKQDEIQVGSPEKLGQPLKDRFASLEMTLSKRKPYFYERLKTNERVTLQEREDERFAANLGFSAKQEQKLDERFSENLGFQGKVERPRWPHDRPASNDEVRFPAKEVFNDKFITTIPQPTAQKPIAKKIPRPENTGRLVLRPQVPLHG